MDQPPPQQILPGEDLAALHHHDGLAVHAAVEFFQATPLFVLVHLAIDRHDHILQQPNGLRQVVKVFVSLCVLTGVRKKVMKATVEDGH